MKQLKLALLLSVAAPLVGQVYSTTMGAVGTNYTSAPTITATGGSCTAEPTFVATVGSGSLTSVVTTFMGTGCLTPPTLGFSGGGGSGAAATANLIPATILVLVSVPTSSGTGVSPAVGGTTLAWQYACQLTVPKARVPVYASSSTQALYRMPQTTQTSVAITSLVNGMGGSVASSFTAAYASGILTEFTDYYVANSSVSAANVEAAIVAACTTAQTNLNNWNPWNAYGTFFNGSAWTVQGYQ